MPSPSFLARPCQDDPYGSASGHLRDPPNTPLRPQLLSNDAQRLPRSILRHTPTPSQVLSPHHPSSNPQIPGPQAPILRSRSPYHHQHTSSSPELRPRVDNAWAPRVRPDPQQPSDLSQTGNALSPSHTFSHIVQRPRADQVDGMQRQSGFAARLGPHFVPGIRGRSASEVRIAHAPPPDLDQDRLARACGQPAPAGIYQHDDRGRQAIFVHTPPSRLSKLGAARHTDNSPSHLPLPKVRVSDMYRRLDALARRSGGRAMDYLSVEDVAIIQKRDNQLREQLRRKSSERLQEKDSNFHAIGAPLEDVLLYASTIIVIGDYQHHIPVVVVACIEELTKNGIYQSGLFRALPSRDRHLQLIDIFDKSADFGVHFNMRGQVMPDICALLSTFISSVPAPLLDTQTCSALWHWSVKPSVRREDARQDQQEEEEEERRARGESPQPKSWTVHTDNYTEEVDSALETDQICVAQILLRFLPSANLSLLMYLCGFFTQLPLCPENGLQLEDVARIFGHRLLGASNKAVSQRMMLWLLIRWHRISETLFGDMCGMVPAEADAPHPQGSAPAVEGSNERMEKGHGKRGSGPDHGLHHSMSSSSHSSPETSPPEDRGVPLRKSSSNEDEEGESSEGSRRRKKRELDAKEPCVNAQVARPPTRKEPRHGLDGRRGSGSRRHRHGHLSEQKDVSTSPDPFAMAFAKAQDLSNAPLLTAPSSSAVARDEGSDKAGVSRFQHGTTDSQRLATPVHANRREDDARPIDVDVRALLRDTAEATDAARSLAKRVEVLERALRLQHTGDDQVGRPIIRSPGGKGGANNRKEDENKDTEDGLRLHLRRVEAERDEAQRIVRDVRAYLLDEGPVLQRG